MLRKSRSSLWLAALLVGAVVLVYANSLTAPFIFDDIQCVTKNNSIRDLNRLERVLNPPLDAAGATGRPLVNLSFALNFAFGGLDVRGYHAVSILLHALGALTLFGLLHRAFRLPALAERWAADAAERAFCIALLWAVHPLLTESVVCVAQRNEVLAGLFYLLVLYAFVRSVEQTPTSRVWQAVSVLACAVGMTAKEIVATAPVLVVLFDRTFVAGTFAAVWRARWKYYLLLASTWLLLAWLMLRAEQRGGIVGFGLGMSWWDYLVTQGHAITLYLKLSLWPHPLVVDYGAPLLPLREVWPQFLLVSSLVIATAWALWRRPRWGFAGAWFFVILGPSSSIVPLTSQTIAEHRMYLPLVAIVAGLTLGLEALAPRWRTWICLGLAIGAATLSVRRNAEYLDEPGLWRTTLQHQPDNARIHLHLGNYHRGRREFVEAAAEFRRATELRPDYALAHSELGIMLMELGRLRESLEQHRIALRLRGEDPYVQYGYGIAAAQAGDTAAAVTAWKKALELMPGMSSAIQRLAEVSAQQGDMAGALARHEAAARDYPNDAEQLDGWGRLLVMAGRYEEAIKRLSAARALRPDVPEVNYNLGNAYLQANRPGEAAPCYERALLLDPTMADARHNLALSRLMQKRYAEAIDLLTQVVRAKPEWTEARLTYAIALAESGRLAEALQAAREAAARDPSSERARAMASQLQQMQRR